MAVNADLANLSDTLFTTAIAVYGGALVSYCGEYAFGRTGRIARTSTEPIAARELVGVGVGGSHSPAILSNDERVSGPELVTPRQNRLTQIFGRVALTLTLGGALLHVASVLLRGVAVGRVPWGNMYEFSSMAGLVAVLTFLTVIIRQPAIRYLGIFVMLPVITLMFLAGTVLYARAAPLVPALRSYWLSIHVSAAILATGVFMISFVATVLYLIRRRYDRLVGAGVTPKRFPISMGWRLPEAASLDRLAYRTVAFAFPVWTFGILAGAIWAEAAWGRYWDWDPKETWAFISWVFYAAYLHARATAGWRGAKAGIVNLVAFGAMTFNFFVVNIVITGLHSYGGLA